MKAGHRAVGESKHLNNLVRESVHASGGIDVSMRRWTGSLYPCFLCLRLDTNKPNLNQQSEQNYFNSLLTESNLTL